MEMLVDLNSGEEPLTMSREQNALISQRIKKAASMEELDEVEEDLGSLAKINDVVKNVVNKLNERKDLHSFFASPAYAKIAAIKNAFNELPIDAKLGLSQLSKVEMIEASKNKETPTEKFLYEMNKHRISLSRGETTSFIQFIDAIQELNNGSEAKNSDELSL